MPYTKAKLAQMKKARKARIQAEKTLHEQNGGFFIAKSKDGRPICSFCLKWVTDKGADSYCRHCDRNLRPVV